MGLKDVLNKYTSRKEIFKKMQDNDAAAHKLEERKKSAEERALEKIYEKKRQETIKSELKRHYKQNDKEYWHKDVITQKPIFKEHGHTLLQQKNLFSGGKNEN